MAKRLSDWLHRVSTVWVALSALLIPLLFSALVLPQRADQAQQETGSPESPDASFFYPPGDLYGVAEPHGQQGQIDNLKRIGLRACRSALFHARSHMLVLSTAIVDRLVENTALGGGLATGGEGKL